MTKQNPDTDNPEQDDVSPEELFSRLATEDSNDSEKMQEKQQNEEGDQEEQNEAEENNHGDEGEGQTEEDPWLLVDESLRNEHQTLKEEHAKLQLDHRANAGRVAALNQKTQQLQQQLHVQEQQQGKLQSDGPTADDLEGKTFEEVKQEWPEVAAFIENEQKRQEQLLEQRFNQRLEEQLNPLRQMHTEYQQQQLNEHIYSEQQRLAHKHPDWRDIAGDSKFQTWISAQPQGVQAMYGSQSAEDNIVLLDLYKSTNGIELKPTQKPVNNQRDLSQHTEIPKKGSSRVGKINVDDIPPEQLFTQLASQQKR